MNIHTAQHCLLLQAAVPIHPSTANSSYLEEALPATCMPPDMCLPDPHPALSDRNCLCTSLMPVHYPLRWWVKVDNPCH